MTTDQRIRGRELQRIRSAHFARDPLCVMCAARGKVRPAVELDHVVPLFKGGADDATNRQGLCAACHAVKTADDMGSRAVGCDAAGLPTDPRHPWNRGRGYLQSLGESARKPSTPLFAQDREIKEGGQL